MKILSENSIKIDSHEYKIILGENFSGLKDFLLNFETVSSFQIITEKKIYDLYGKELKSELENLNIPIHFIFMKGKEKNKHIKKVKSAYNQLIYNGADRKSVIIALGGGVVGDYAGFISATFLRGLRFVQIPTTLLACVDSSVGGKVAVNADLGKNMIGAFHQPILVFAPIHTLSSLPEKEWRCGYAEVLKHSLLSGGSFFNFMSSITQEETKKTENIVNYIKESVQFKASIVSQDPKEKGVRAVLNLGHTTGHAIESLLNYKKLSHGEAVGIGLVTALMLSMEKFKFPEEAFFNTLKIMNAFGLRKSIKLNPNKIFKHMQHDKKTIKGKIYFVLLNSPGDFLFGVEVTEEEIIRVLQKQVNHEFLESNTSI